MQKVERIPAKKHADLTRDAREVVLTIGGPRPLWSETRKYLMTCYRRHKIQPAWEFFERPKTNDLEAHSGIDDDVLW